MISEMKKKIYQTMRSKSRRKALEHKMWGNLDTYAKDPKRNPLLLGWYSLNDVLAVMIIPALDKLIEDNVGVPSEITRRYATIEEADHEWKRRLREIKAGFEAFKQIENIEYETEEEHQRLVGVYEHGMKMFARYYPNLWD